MGIVIRQSVKYSVLNYLGAVIGIISTLFIYPLAIDSYGMVRWFIDIAALATPFVMLGANSLAVKYFPEFWISRQQNKNSLLSLLLIWVLFGLTVFSLAWFLFSGSIQEFFSTQSAQRSSFYTVLYPLTVFFILGTFFTQYASNYKRIVIPSLLFEILIKITMPVFILGMVYLSWKLDVLVYGVVASYAIAAVALLFYLYRLGAFRSMDFKDSVKKVGYKAISSYALFGLFSALGAILALRIDRVMVGYLLGDTINGIFSIVVTLGVFMEIPFRSITKIASPLVSNSMSINDMREVEKVYKGSSLNLMLIGAVLFTGIWWLIDEVFLWMPNGEEIAAGKYVIFYYGLAVWINMITSVNTQIIGFSNYYRVNFYAYLVLAVLNVVMNWIFIKQFGMVGASMATLASIGLFNAIKSGFIWWKFKIHPFSGKTVQTLFLSGVIWCLLLILFSGRFIGFDFPSVVSFLIKGVFIVICFGAGMIWLNLSPELTAVIKDPLSVILPGKSKK